MYTHIINTNLAKLEAELRAEKSKIARAFNQGKSMSEMNDVVEKIHKLEEKFNALKLKDFHKQ
jgi:hypothetical protein